jgi:hypothetical protein
LFSNKEGKDEILAVYRAREAKICRNARYGNISENQCEIGATIVSFQTGHKQSPGGKKGNKGGPKPNWFRQWANEAIRKESRLKRLEEMLDTGDSKEFWEVFKYLQEVANGKPAQAIVGHDGEDLQINVNVRHYGH